MKTSFLNLFFLAVLASCVGDSHQQLSLEEYNKLSDDEKRLPHFGAEGIDLTDKDLSLKLFASEPMMVNPTNMDIDDKGRVWICEAFNYRNHRNPRNPYKPQGDRILIMEDSNGDGVADTSKVFYQGEDINSALGIAVMGNKVIVSVSPNVWIFTDEDGDDVPDKKEILFTGVGGEQHDHGMHAFTFGPDGKFYFSYGNAGNGLLTRNEEPILDDLGRPITGKGEPYQEGMVFRSDIDGSNVEILGWNFRNNYEVAVDSYGRMWQSDNDDDGNRGTRINYVMDYGNYGFKDEMTGSDWRTRRVNMEDSVFHQHWHLNDPGVVPNLLQTYAGSPTGIAIYEGSLLPKKYQNQIIHCDAGPNGLRAYPVEKDGAGFRADILPILNGNERDSWFRPSDVSVAPDGSIFVADWYDPGVGGHAMGDSTRGRVYRIAPKGHSYQFTAPDYSTLEGAIRAFNNPNIATRYKAFYSLLEMGKAAIPSLEKLFIGDDERLAARAFWLLSKIDPDWIPRGLDSQSEDMRVAAVKALRQSGNHSETLLLTLAKDTSAQVRREVALSIRHKRLEKVWVELAKSYKSGDRWFLEALGIAADLNWNQYLAAYIDEIGDDWQSSAEARDIVWRSRASYTSKYISQLIVNDKAQQERYYRALDFQGENQRLKVLNARLAESGDQAEKVLILRQIEPSEILDKPKKKQLVRQTLEGIEDDSDFIEIIDRFSIKSEGDRLLSIIDHTDNWKDLGKAVHLFYKLYGIEKVIDLCKVEKEDLALKRIKHFGYVDKRPVTNFLVQTFRNDDLSDALRQQAMDAMNGGESEKVLWDLVQQNKVPQLVMPRAKDLLLRTWNQKIQIAATAYFDSQGEKDIDLDQMMAATGDIEKGNMVFKSYCASCHIVNGAGVDFGPGLSQIGAKLSKEGLYNAILNPSEGMGFGYETQKVTLKDGTELLCLITSQTENDVYLKLVGQAEPTAYPIAEVSSIEEQDISLMPKFPLTESELIDLVAYLQTLE